MKIDYVKFEGKIYLRHVYREGEMAKDGLDGLRDSSGLFDGV